MLAMKNLGTYAKDSATSKGLIMLHYHPRFWTSCLDQTKHKSKSLLLTTFSATEPIIYNISGTKSSIVLIRIADFGAAEAILESKLLFMLGAYDIRYA